MDIIVSDKVINTVYNSLRASKYSLRSQLASATEGSNKKEIIKHQLAEVEEAIRIFDLVQ